MKDFRIIVVAPTGRDSQLICDLLVRAGIEAVRCADCISACRETEAGVGAFVLADEVLDSNTMVILTAFISRQEPWSDLPVIVLTQGGEATLLSEARRKLREPLGNVVPVERPVRSETLISMVQSSIRARRRQYDVRGHIRQEMVAAEALRRAEKLAVAGRLSASMAHEINNPLEAVTNLLYLTASASSLDQAKRYVAIADHELARVSEITRQALRFHRGNMQPADVKVAEILDSALTLFALRLAAKGVVVDRRFDHSATIVGFGGELRQLVVNLISNSFDAMPAGGRLRLKVTRVSENHNGRRPGVRVVVADTGSGIPIGIRDKVLEPFISSKTDTGTGLGLWISSEIVRKHGGALRFRSRPGSGTVFSIFLPAHLPSCAAAA
jgi:signal transduction histidine kinase